MKTVEEKKRDRFLFLEEVYKACEGNPDYMFGDLWEEVTNPIFQDPAYFSEIQNYLMREGLITGMGITHEGVIEYENAYSNPDQPTEHFPAINLTINNISGNSQSNIQVGNHNSASIELSQSDLEYFENLERYLRTVLLILENQGEGNAELIADHQTLKAQLESPKPKKSILQEVAKSIKNIAEGALAGVIANGYSGPELLGMLAKLPF